MRPYAQLDVRARLLRRGTGEVRGALLAQGGETLGRVGPTEAVELESQRRVERRSEHPVPVVERLLGPPDRALRAVGELDGDLVGGVEQHVVVDAQRDQPDAL